VKSQSQRLQDVTTELAVLRTENQALKEQVCQRYRPLLRNHSTVLAEAQPR
jgi:hypothetical protein